MNINFRIERAILVALLDHMRAAGFQPAAVWTDEMYVMAGNKEVQQRKAPLHCKQPMNNAEVLKVFDDFDMGRPTVHFCEQNSTSWGARGVMVVPGNGEDFISDYHSSNIAFNEVVERVADTAHEGELTLVPMLNEGPLLKALRQVVICVGKEDARDITRLALAKVSK